MDTVTKLKMMHLFWSFTQVKKDYLAEGAMADSADLVVLGAYYGTGNKGAYIHSPYYKQINKQMLKEKNGVEQISHYDPTKCLLRGDLK